MYITPMNIYIYIRKIQMLYIYILKIILMQEVPTNLNTLHSQTFKSSFFFWGQPTTKKRLLNNHTSVVDFRCRWCRSWLLSSSFLKARKLGFSWIFLFQQSWDQKIKGWLEIHEISILYRGLFAKYWGFWLLASGQGSPSNI